MSSKSNSAKPVKTPETNKKGFTNNWISEGQVFRKIFMPISVKKEEYKYNNKYHKLDTEELSENTKIKNNNTIISSISQDIQVNEIKEENSKMKIKLQNIKELYDVEQITTEILQALINSLNSDYITAQEELKAKIKKITCNFNIKKHYMEKDMQSKQRCIKSLEVRNIVLN